ncbi:hypothetical protein BH11BAC7_BH11BAC7_21710 [soil metagenome]
MKKSLLFLFGSFVFAGSMSAQTVFFSEDFESGFPSAWTASPASGAWVVPGVSSSSYNPGTHTAYASINDDASQASANANSNLITPVINLSAASTVLLQYDCYYGHGTYQSITEAADLQYSIDGGATYTTYGTLPVGAWSVVTVNLTTQLAGQSNVKLKWHYSDNGGWLFGASIDNVSLFSPPPFDANLTAVTPLGNGPASFGLVASNVNIGGTFLNTGLNTITAIDVKYSDGMTTWTQSLTSLNVASYASYTFTHNVPYTIPSLGAHPLTVWVELVNDANPSNDAGTTIVTGAAIIPVHHVTIEEGTGTWCGWCVRGMVFLDDMNTQHPTDCDLIAVHNADPMTNTIYDGGVSGIIPGYPSTLVGRDEVSDPSNIFTDYANHINDFGYANLTPVVTFNATTRVATVIVSANFAVDLAGDYRLACVFTENNVSGTVAGYNQTNYYSGGANGPMAMPGYDFAALPSPVPAAQMVYDYVARTIVGGFNGAANSLPATIPAASTQTYTFTYTVPAAYNIANMKATVLLIDNTTATKHIMNSAGMAVPVGITESSALNGVSVYPNPFSETTTVELNLLSNDVVVVEMFDMTGKLVTSQNEGELAAGKHNIALNGSNLADGMYFVKITAGTSVVTQKVSIAH